MSAQYALGRIVNHDERSLKFPAPQASTHSPVKHRIYGSVLNQGDIGACVLNASGACLNSAPFHQPRARLVKEGQTLVWYQQATAIDSCPGQYPPDDTGTDINAAGQVLRAAGLIAGWDHAFGLDHVLGALQNKGVLLGVNWHRSMFAPDRQGYVHPDGVIDGGHEIFIYADDAIDTVTIRNSWGRGWGLHGDFKLRYVDLMDLLADKGDAAQFRAA